MVGFLLSLTTPVENTVTFKQLLRHLMSDYDSPGVGLNVYESIVYDNGAIVQEMRLELRLVA